MNVRELDMFAKNQWYVVAWDFEVEQKPLARMICGEPVVVFRDTEGRVAALEDVCPHRLVPLSLGTLEGDAIRCRYHGLLVDGGGRCREMPGGDPINANVKARAYPVVERYRFVWVWMGDPALSDEASLPNLWMNEHPDWRADGGVLHVKCDYRLVIDNLMDLSHETYVHASSIGQKEIHDFPIETTVVDGEVITQRWMPAIEPAPMYRAALGNTLEGTSGLVDRWQICRFIPPSGIVIDVGVTPVALGATLEKHDQGGIRGFVLDFITPETENTCHYFWGAARIGDLSNEEQIRSATAQQRAVFMEDVEILEAQQRNIELLADRKLRAFSVDSGGVRSRILLKKIIDRENLTNSASDLS
ncbi:Rieske (2Fe-2S) protein [Sphingobium sp. AEW4]|nr:Rieske (2Fe-2S) protein [Sphingobium sp. AEW4]